MHRILPAVAVATVLGTSLISVTTADATVPARSYVNCKALNKVYKHGVARKGAHDRVKGTTKPVTNFKVRTKVYHLNDGVGDKNRARGERDLDRDNDGVACEKH